MSDKPKPPPKPVPWWITNPPKDPGGNRDGNVGR